MSHWLTHLPQSPLYQRLHAVMARGECLVLDGGVATELQRRRSDGRSGGEDAEWGAWALQDARSDVLDMHQQFAAAGADVLSTNTWAILTHAEHETGRRAGPDGLPAWTESARAAVRLARSAADTASQGLDRAVAFCINEDLGKPALGGHLELLSWVWAEEPPDLVIVETLGALPDATAVGAMSMITDAGLPLWISMRLTEGGLCDRNGVVHTPLGEPELVTRLSNLADIGVEAILVNCVPPEHVLGAVRRLVASTALPVGCYPSLGRPGADGWEFDRSVTADDYPGLAVDWRAAGARVIGGCCGVTAQHIGALARSLKPDGRARGRRAS